MGFWDGDRYRTEETRKTRERRIEQDRGPRTCGFFASINTSSPIHSPLGHGESLLVLGVCRGDRGAESAR